MRALVAVNGRFGKRTVFVGSMGVPHRPLPSPAASASAGGTPATETGQAWAMRRERMSPRYTTRWDEIVVALAK